MGSAHSYAKIETESMVKNSMVDSEVKKTPSGEAQSQDNFTQNPNSSSNPTSGSNLKNKVRDTANQWMERNRSLVLRQTPIWARSLIVFLLSLGSIAVLGSIFIRIDEVISVGGQLKSIGGTVAVKTPAGGKVSEIFFEDGDFVKKGDLLVRFDTRQASQEKQTLEKLIELEKKGLVSRLNTVSSQKDSLFSQKQVAAQRLKTSSKIADDMKLLVQQGGFQRIQYLKTLDDKYALEKQVAELDERISQLDLRSEQIKFDSSKTLDQLNNNLKGVELQLQYQNVTATVSGVIFDPQASAQGVLNSGERILSIVPQGELYAEIYVSNGDIGFVKEGIQTKVRVEAFPFTRYGELSAVVTQIGADALPPDTTNQFFSFPVKLKLNKSYLETNGIKIPLKPGMSVSANLKLRDKRLVSILSDLLVDQSDSLNKIRQQ